MRYEIKKYAFHCNGCYKQEELEISDLDLDDRTVPPGWCLKNQPILGERGQELMPLISHYCPKCRPDQ